MAEISAAKVKALRDKTGLPMMDCKRALTEAGGDEAAAVEALTRKAKGKLELRGARETGQGRIGLWISDDKKVGGLIELRCETAQVARNETFIELANTIAAQVGQGTEAEPAGDAVLASAVIGQSGKTVGDLVAESFAKLQENTKLVRCRRITGDGVAGYLHFDGTTAVLVALEPAPADGKVATDLCQHIAFTKPMAITAEQLPADEIERVRASARQIAEEEGKPAQIIEKIVEGKVRAFCKENALNDQEHVKPDYEKKSIGEVLKAAGINAVTDMAVFRVGAG